MEQKNHFWKGALVGALAMFIVCGIVGIVGNING